MIRMWHICQIQCQIECQNICQVECQKRSDIILGKLSEYISKYMSWNVIGGITWSKVMPFYFLISFYIVFFWWKKMFFLFYDFECFFWFLDQQNHVVSNPLRPTALLSLAECFGILGEYFPLIPMVPNSWGSLWGYDDQGVSRILFRRCLDP